MYRRPPESTPNETPVPCRTFFRSLIETAIDVTDGQIAGRYLQAVVELGKVLLDHPVQLLDGVIEGVDALTDEYRVMIITKGDLLHQESKVARSGLADGLWHVDRKSVV